MKTNTIANETTLHTYTEYCTTVSREIFASKNIKYSPNLIQVFRSVMNTENVARGGKLRVSKM